MSTALLIIDMINTLDFPEGKSLLKYSLPVAKNILRLKKKFRAQKKPVIYVNDNFGMWRSSWLDVYEKCSRFGSMGAELALMLKPDEKDYIILKPKHSGFYSTNLDNLLAELKVKKLVITGIAGNICVLFTANDAHMRGYEIHVPKNCIASASVKLNDFVTLQLSKVFKIETSKI